jgi:hypothetical protein
VIPSPSATSIPTATEALTDHPKRTSTSRPTHATGEQNSPDCSLEARVSDVTIPDGAGLEPGEIFAKIWRFENTGTCTWNYAQFQLAYADGERFSGPDMAKAYFYPPGTALDVGYLDSTAWQNVIGKVPPGQAADVPLLLKAPEEKGIYHSYWRLENSDGEQVAYLWIAIRVKTEAEIDEVSWSGEWSHINTWFAEPDAPPETMLLEQKGDQLFGFFYPQSGNQAGELVFVDGRVSADRLQAEGLFEFVWGAPTRFQWTMAENHSQFQGRVFSESTEGDQAWCGGRNEMPPPICIIEDQEP